MNKYLCVFICFFVGVIIFLLMRSYSRSNVVEGYCCKAGGDKPPAPPPNPAPGSIPCSKFECKLCPTDKCYVNTSGNCVDKPEGSSPPSSPCPGPPSPPAANRCSTPCSNSQCEKLKGKCDPSQVTTVLNANPTTGGCDYTASCPDDGWCNAFDCPDMKKIEPHLQMDTSSPKYLDKVVSVPELDKDGYIAINNSLSEDMVVWFDLSTFENNFISQFSLGKWSKSDIPNFKKEPYNFNDLSKVPDETLFLQTGSNITDVKDITDTNRIYGESPSISGQEYLLDDGESSGFKNGYLLNPKDILYIRLWGPCTNIISFGIWFTTKPKDQKTYIRGAPSATRFELTANQWQSSDCSSHFSFNYSYVEGFNSRYLMYYNSTEFDKIGNVPNNILYKVQTNITGKKIGTTDADCNIQQNFTEKACNSMAGNPGFSGQVYSCMSPKRDLESKEEYYSIGNMPVSYDSIGCNDKFPTDAGLTDPGHVCNCLEAWYGKGGTTDPIGRQVTEGKKNKLFPKSWGNTIHDVCPQGYAWSYQEVEPLDFEDNIFNEPNWCTEATNIDDRHPWSKLSDVLKNPLENGPNKGKTIFRDSSALIHAYAECPGLANTVSPKFYLDVTDIFKNSNGPSVRPVGAQTESCSNKSQPIDCTVSSFNPDDSTTPLLQRCQLGTTNNCEHQGSSSATCKDGNGSPKECCCSGSIIKCNGPLCSKGSKCPAEKPGGDTVPCPDDGCCPYKILPDKDCGTRTKCIPGQKCKNGECPTCGDFSNCCCPE